MIGLRNALASRSEVPKELTEIAKIRAESPIDDEPKSVLHDSVLDEIESLPDSETQKKEAQEFGRVAMNGLRGLPVTTYESPGEQDPTYGKFTQAKDEIAGLPEIPYSKRRKPTLELFEIEELARRRQLTPEQRWQSHENDIDDVRDLPDSDERDEFQAAVEAGLQELSVASHESPADTDPAFGQTAPPKK